MLNWDTQRVVAYEQILSFPERTLLADRGHLLKKNEETFSSFRSFAEESGIATG